MKCKQIAVLVSNKKDDVYEVALTEEQRQWLKGWIEGIHGGKIEVNKKKIESIELFNHK